MTDEYNPQSLNRYVYCLNNPLIYTDPTGNFWQKTDDGYVQQVGPPEPQNTAMDAFLTNYWDNSTNASCDEGSFISQKTLNSNDGYNILLLTQLVFAEGSSDWKIDNAMEGIAWVVKNRVESKKFPNDYYDVIHQKNKNGPEFSSVYSKKNEQWKKGGDPSSLSGPNAKAYSKANEVATGVIKGTISDPTNNSLFFTLDEPTSDMSVNATYGSTNFYNLIK